jgi:hypothetical protein
MPDKIYLIFIEHEYCSSYVIPIAMYHSESRAKEEIDKLHKETGNDYLYEEYEVK